MKKYKPFLFFVIMASLIFTVGCKKNPSPAALPPTITNINPSSGTAGATVTITGTNFSFVAANNTVKFNGTAASVTSATATSLVVTAPAAGTTGAVSVSTGSGNANGSVFTYLLAPTITSIIPTSGIAGTSVTITGTNFDATASNNTVKFNGTAAVVTNATATSLVVTAPVGGSTGTVTVATSGGTATGPVFIYLLPPTITSISPTSGAAGISDTITGTNFDPVAVNNTVKFNGVAATIISGSATSLVVTVPALGSTGVVTVANGGGNATGPSFTYVAGPDIYVCGLSTGNVASYWKNGIQNNVATDCYAASSIYVAGTNVVVSGTASGFQPKYWVNGTGFTLNMTPGYTQGSAYSVSISQGIVYTAGYEQSGGNGPMIPQCWQNGTELNPYNQTNNLLLGGQVRSVFATGASSYYLAGFLPDKTVQANLATYWVNGVASFLSGTSESDILTGIYVSGSDVYTCGYGSSSGHIFALYGKNTGALTYLNVPDNTKPAYATSIYVSGTDVYIAGFYNSLAVYWKNGVMVNLTNTVPTISTNEAAWGITGNGTDIYICGNDQSKGVGYWKNGVFTALPSCSSVTGIFVK